MILIVLCTSCSKWDLFNKKESESNLESPLPPAVVTGKVLDGDENYAVLAGEIIDLSNDQVTEYGHCWSTSKPQPTIQDAKTNLGARKTLGSYTSTLTELIANATYYVRAYALNKAGVSYGAAVSYVAKPQTYINIALPISSSVWKKGKTYDIKWSENSSDNVQIDLMVAGTVYQNISASAPASGVFAWTVNTDLPEASYYTIKITSTKNSLVTDESSTFTIANDATPPTIQTITASSISDKSCVVGGNVTFGGGSIIDERGVCYSTSPNPTINSTKSVEAGTIGAFYTIVSNLTPGTTYFYRAFASSKGGVGYGAELSFRTLDKQTIPILDLPIVKSVGSTTATVSANILSIGGSAVTTRGVCWSTKSGPTIADNASASGSGEGVYEASLLGMPCNSLIYVRAYAQNAIGIAYSQEITLNTSLPVAPDLTFISIKGGAYSMGSTSGALNQQPVHTVTLKDFNISATEITNTQYAHFLNEYQSSSVQGGTYAGLVMVAEDPMGVTLSGSVWKPQAGYENMPAVSVTWYGAYEFCRFYGLRLPTEAEWEYAAKGGENKDTYKYSGSDDANSVAWYYGNSLGATNPVGKKVANSLGLYDMSGNAWEWVSDWYGNYPIAPQVNPQGSASGTVKVMRGGSRGSDPSGLTVATRSSANPDFKHTTVGFRVAK